LVSSKNWFELRGRQSTAEAALEMLKGKSHWLFSCHGSFDWQYHLRSGLKMNGNQRLTLDMLHGVHGLGSPRLVVLSACESGLHDVHGSPEEFIGLPAAFLGQGATGVLATLWPVDDASTALLVSRFFHYHLTEKMRPAAALQAAQLWLRDLTVECLRALVKDANILKRSELLTSGVIEFLRYLNEAKPDERPFQHPIHWGGLAIYGY